MFKLKLDQKITYSIGLSIVFLFLVSIVAYFVIYSATSGFSAYREMARDTNLAGRVQANMLMVRMNVKDFIITSSEKDIKQYHEYVKKTEAFVEEAKKEITRAGRAEKIKKVDEELELYEESFEKVVTLMQERHKIVQETLVNIGPKIEQNLTKVFRTLVKMNNQKGSIAASEGIRALLLTRLYAMKFLDNNSQAAVDRVIAEKKEFMEDINTLLKVTNGVERRIVKETEKLFEQYSSGFLKLVKVIHTRNDIIKNTLDRIGPAIAKEIEDVKLDIKAVQDKIGPELQASNSRGQLIIIIVSIVALVLGIVIVVSIRKAIMTFSRSTVESIKGFVLSSEQISAGNTDLSSRTQEQASSLEETASTIEEITSTIKQTAENAQNADSLTSQALKVVTAGSEVSINVQSAMEEITSSSNKIADIVNLVDEIAFQTNILAINAAIEAAKAGDQGKGFAVVAIEVRDLAQRSADAAKEIKGLIDTSIEKVNGGSELVVENTEKLGEISQSVQKVADIMNEISAATNEQANGVEQINRAISELDSVTQQNSSLVEEVASLAENMNTEAGKMNGVMEDTFSNSSSSNDAQTHVTHKSSAGMSFRSQREVKSIPSSSGSGDVVEELLTRSQSDATTGEDF